MTLDERDARWEAARPAVREAVAGWLKRAYAALPNAELARHEERGGQSRKGPAGAPAHRGTGRPVFQQSLDETVQWHFAAGRWELVLPWQVISKLRNLERVVLVQVAKPARRQKDGTMSVPEEQEVAKRLRQVAADLEGRILAGRGPMGFHLCAVKFLRSLAARYLDMPLNGVKVHAVNTGAKHSFYYEFEALPHDEAKAAREWARAEANVPEAQANQMQNWRARAVLAGALHDADLAWACEVVLRGQPVRLSNFYLEPLHLLHRADGTNLRLALVHVASRPMPFGPVEMDGEAQSGANKFKDFLRTRASGAFHGGDAVVHQIWEMLDWHWDNREVFEVTSYGYHNPKPGELGGKVPPSGAWFSPTACCDHQGRWHRPDAHGAFFIPVPGGRKRRYQVAEVDAEGNAFKVPAPAWTAEPLWPAAKLRGAFAEVCDRLVRAVGGLDALMGLGVSLAYGTGPEYFAKFRSFPGVWTHGEKGQGKTNYAICLAKFWGLGDTRLNLEAGSGPGLESALTQLGELPLVLEEFQGNAKEGITKVLKLAFNRDKIAKQVKGGGRTPLTTPIVIGQATSTDPATRSRYLHVGVSSSRRQGTEEEQKANFDWLVAEREWFGEFGRFILSHRSEFAERFLAHHAEWLADPLVEQATRDGRARETHGVAIAGLRAMWDILGEPRELAEMREWLVEELARAAGETGAQVELNQFLQKWATAVERGHFSKDGSLRRIFHARLVGVRECPPPDAGGLLRPTAAQRRKGAVSAGWESWELRFKPAALFDSLREYAKQQNLTLPLSQADVQAQLAARPCWRAARKPGRKGGDRQRFEGDRHGAHYWALALDDLPGFGYRAMGDREFRLWDEGAQFRLDGGAVVRGVWATDAEALAHPDLAAHPDAAHLLLTESGEDLWFDTAGRQHVQCVGGYTRADAPDPRKGPFYRLVEALNQPESGDPAAD